MNLKYDNLNVEWLGNTIPMETMNRSTSAASQVDGYLSQLEEEDMGFDVCPYLSAPMLDAKYEKVNIDDVISDHCQHLIIEQQQDLRGLLSKYRKLFDGNLGKYPGEPMHIKLEDGAQPVYRRPYPIPTVHMATFKKELDHLVEIGVLLPVWYTEW